MPNHLRCLCLCSLATVVPGPCSQACERPKQVLPGKALAVESEGRPNANFTLKAACHGQSFDLQLTHANKVPAREADPLSPLPLRWRAAHVHTLHSQAMGIESAQVGGPCWVPSSGGGPRCQASVASNGGFLATLRFETLTL